MEVSTIATPIFWFILLPCIFFIVVLFIRFCILKYIQNEIDRGEKNARANLRWHERLYLRFDPQEFYRRRSSNAKYKKAMKGIVLTNDGTAVISILIIPVLLILRSVGIISM